MQLNRIYYTLSQKLNSSIHKGTIEYLLRQIGNISDPIMINETFLFHCHYGTLESVKEMLTKDVDINYKNSYPLRVAAKGNNLPIVKLLLEYGADPKVYNGIIMKYAIRNDNVEMVEMLLSDGRLDIIVNHINLMIRSRSMLVLEFTLKNIKYDKEHNEYIADEMYLNQKIVRFNVIEKFFKQCNLKYPTIYLLEICVDNNLSRKYYDLAFNHTIKKVRPSDRDELLWDAIYNGNFNAVKIFTELFIYPKTALRKYLRRAKRFQHPKIIDYLKTLCK